MKRAGIAFATLFLVLSAPFVAVHAQDKTSPEAKPEPVASTPIRLKFVLMEFEGDKKVKSLPYTIFYKATHNRDLQPDFSRLRIGARTPVATGSAQYQYQDVGTNLDCRAVRNDDGRFLVDFSVEHSWVEGAQDVLMSPSPHQQGPGADLFKQPVIGNIRTGHSLLFHDGQTIETTAATDPITGRVYRIEVTLNVVK